MVQDDFEDGSQERARSARAIGRGFGIAQRIISNCISFLVPVVAGYYFDAYFNTGPVFLLTGVFVGMSFGGMNLYYFVCFLQKAEMGRSEKLKRSPKKLPMSEGPIETLESEADPWEQEWEEKWSNDRWEKDES